MAEEKAPRYKTLADEKAHHYKVFNESRIFTKSLIPTPKQINDYHRAAQEGSADAQNSLGICYKYGRGVKKDLVKAVELFKLAANQGHVEAQNDIGDIYIMQRKESKNEDVRKKLLEDAIPLFKFAAEQGSADARVSLGSCYLYGMGMDRDFEKGIGLIRQAFDQGNGSAQAFLAMSYTSGKNGFGKNLALAIHCYELAVKQGNATAQYILGVHFEKGDGVEKDPVLAIGYYKLGAMQGNDHAKRAFKDFTKMDYDDYSRKEAKNCADRAASMRAELARLPNYSVPAAKVFSMFGNSDLSNIIIEYAISEEDAELAPSSQNGGRCVIS